MPDETTKPCAKRAPKLRLPQRLLALGSGALTALAFPGALSGALVWVSLVPFLLLALRPRGKREMAGLFATFGAGFFPVLMYWFLAMHPLTWLGFTEVQSLVIVIGAWTIVSGLLTLQLAGVGALWAALSRRLGPEPGGLHVLGLAGLWMAYEFASSVGPFGFTWSSLATTQTQALGIVQVVDLFGAFPLSALIVGVNAALALGLRRQYGVPLAGRAWRPAAVALGLAGLGVGYSAYRLAEKLPEPTFTVGLVQGNVAGGEKWAHGDGALKRMADKYLGLSAKLPQADLVLWPETAMPAFLRNVPALGERLASTARSEQRTYMFGTLDWDGFGKDQVLYNAVTAIGPDGRSLGFDYKRHLVPFGEYVPFRKLLPEALMQAMGLVNVLGVDYAPSPRVHIFDLPYAKIGTGVCFDGIFPDAMRPATLAGAEVLALVTNDAWYKDTTAPRALHAQAVLRAVENRRYVMRAANTGISSVIDAHGNPHALTPVFKDAAVVAPVAPLTTISLYTRLGDVVPAATLVALVGGLALGWIRDRLKKPSAA